MHERVQMYETIHLFGSIPCGGPFSSLQELNLAKQGEKYQGNLQIEGGKSLELANRFIRLTEIAIVTGGTSSFQGPKSFRGWREDSVLKMVSRFNMFASYPTGREFGLKTVDKIPLLAGRVSLKKAVS